MNWACISIAFTVSFSGVGSTLAWGELRSIEHQPNPALPELIDRLRSNQPDVRTLASAELEITAGAGLDPADAHTLLLAAADIRNPDDWPVAVELVRAAFSNKEPGLVQTVRTVFADLLHPAKQEVLSQLSFMPGPTAAPTFITLFTAHARDESMTSLPTLGFARAGQPAEAIFPALLAWADDPRFGSSVYQVCLEYAARGTISAPLLDRIDPVAVRSFERWNQAQWRGPGAAGWWWSDDYAPQRHKLCILLSLFGYMGPTQSIAALTNALTLEDPRLRLFAATALIRRRQPVDAALLRGLGAELETRTALYELLAGLGRLDQFPHEFTAQQQLAEGDLARWLCQPGELSGPPAAMELIKSFPVESGQEEWYLFRYRVQEPHWASDTGWMIGVAGPYGRAQPSPRGSGTFSTLQPWTEATAEEFERALRDTAGR